MQFTKLFLVFVTLLGGMCRSKRMIVRNNADGLGELEESAIQMITTCYAKKDKTIVILGDYHKNLMKKLSLQQNFSLLLLDDMKRAENNVNYWDEINQLDWDKRNINRRHKVHIVVTTVAMFSRFTEMLTTFMRSPYFNTAASLLILGLSSKNKFAGCDGQIQTFLFFHKANLNNFLNVNLMCRDRTKGIVIYGYNPFKNRAPEPWRLVKSAKIQKWAHNLSYFIREYRKNERMCDNLDFDKTHDLDGMSITTVEGCSIGKVCSGKPVGNVIRDIVWLEEKKRFDFIANFIIYVNATRRYIWQNGVDGYILNAQSGIISQPYHLMGWIGRMSSSYVHGRDCIFLVSQFRGNKSQLDKIISIIDSYSWIGVCIVFFITLMFFKFFLHQPLIAEIVNLFRLISNSSLTTRPSNIASRIYLGCLLFFVVTMHGIFSGNLAALLTHDFPARQVNSITDLADLNYTVYVAKTFFSYFDDSVFKNHIIEKVPNENCIDYVKRDPSIACLTWGSSDRVAAVNSDLYLSADCIAVVYITNVIEKEWFLEERLNKFLGIVIGGGIMMDLEALVYEKRLLENESKQISSDPVIMNLRDLGFAFAFLGNGLGCAFIMFIAETIIHRFHGRVRLTRVIVIN